MTFSRENVAAALRFSVPTLLGITLFSIGYSGSVRADDHANDGPPTVTITAPRNNSTYNWNTLVNYSIVVSYQGKSTRYQEIPSNQVLLTATYVSDLSKVAGKPSAVGRTPDGLLDIVRSNCMGCHEFKAKAMGPSFAAIAERYPQSQTAIDMLSRFIREGSTGIWGPDNMPPHPELTEDQVHAIVLWIMNNAANPNVGYYVGTEGAIRMEAPGARDSKGGMMLTASYTSPVPVGDSQQAPYGEATVIVHGN